MTKNQREETIKEKEKERSKLVKEIDGMTVKREKYQNVQNRKKVLEYNRKLKKLREEKAVIEDVLDIFQVPFPLYLKIFTILL